MLSPASSSATLFDVTIQRLSNQHRSPYNEGYRTEQFSGIYLESPSTLIRSKKRRYLQPDAVEMPVYILYIRRTDGSISRYENFRFRGFEAAAMYIYEETLVGWPESRVFWQHKDGYSAGLAPTETNLFS